MLIFSRTGGPPKLTLISLRLTIVIFLSPAGAGTSPAGGEF
jgi:hypothetical protein